MAPARSIVRPTAAAARTGWDEAIDVWEDFQETGKDFSRDRVHGRALLEAIGSVRGVRVLDLGCGQGRFTRRVAAKGARVTGIDWSSKMIEAAKCHEAARPLGIEYYRLDARRAGARWPPGTFGMIVACMSLMDMPDLPRVLRGAHRLLQSGGRLVFSISHPVNSAAVRWERSPGGTATGAVVDRYFDERVGTIRWNMQRLKRPFETVYWHRSLAAWYAMLRRAGFVVTNLREPRATALDARRNPLLASTRRIPFFLVLECRKAAEAPRTAARRNRSPVRERVPPPFRGSRPRRPGRGPAPRTRSVPAIS